MLVFLENTSENLGEVGKTAEVYEMKLEERKYVPENTVCVYSLHNLIY